MIHSISPLKAPGNVPAIESFPSQWSHTLIQSPWFQALAIQNLYQIITMTQHPDEQPMILIQHHSYNTQIKITLVVTNIAALEVGMAPKANIQFEAISVNNKVSEQ